MEHMLKPGITPWLRAGAVVLLMLAGGMNAGAQPEDDAAALERRIKGALLYRFISYIDWPPSAAPKPDSPLVVGILGQASLAAELESFAAGRIVNKRPIVVRSLRGPEAAKGLHIVFVGRAAAAQLPAVIRAAGPSLVVTEWPGALQQGSVINFLTVNDQVRFEISLEAARQRDLEISSRLLTVAHNAQELRP
jgi:hypothetical protein